MSGLSAGLPPVAWVLLSLAAALLPAAGGTRTASRSELRVGKRRALDRCLPLTLDLLAAALRSGRPVPEALLLAAPAAETASRATLEQVAGLLRLGADAGQAWAVVPRAGPLGQVAAVGVRSARSGIKLAGAAERLATELRAAAAAEAAARAQRAGVQAMAPLAACFLPSFVCLGVVPVVAGVARGVLGTVA